MKKALRNTVVIGLVVGGVILAVFAGWRYAGTASTAVASADIIAQGRQIYADQCAACHGAELEGQPGWRSPLPSGRLPAPPHDASGHTWHHPDAQLLAITRHGLARVIGQPDYRSAMPAYEGVLSDAEILAALSWIKSRWPPAVRARHDAVNAQARGAGD